MLVIASPGHFDVNEPVMRALSLTGTTRARSLRVSTILGPSPQRKQAITESDPPVVPLWLGAMEAESGERTTVRAPNAHVAYARVRALFEQRSADEEIRNLVCQVDDPSDARLLPPDYPGVDAGRTQAWFDDLVRWWQLDRSELVDRRLVAFNHGERIRRRWGDQVERAARMLEQRADSSRALIQLVAPRETGRYDRDERDLDAGSFPAFTLAEVSLTVRDGRRYLDCFAYFRKQELQYWWPVNLAELAQIQQAVCDEFTDDKPQIGRIATFSAIALWAEDLPHVAVPEVDRLVDLPERLWLLAAAIAQPDSAEPDVKSEWRRVLDDLSGEGRSAPAQPRLGLQRLLEQIDRAAAIAPGPQLGAVRGSLQGLKQQHEAFEDGGLNAAAAKLIRDLVAELRGAVTAALGDLP